MIRDRHGRQIEPSFLVRFNPGRAYETTAPAPHRGRVVRVNDRLGFVEVKPNQLWIALRPMPHGYVDRQRVETMFLSCREVGPREWVCMLPEPREHGGEWIEIEEPGSVVH